MKFNNSRCARRGLASTLLSTTWAALLLGAGGCVSTVVSEPMIGVRPSAPKNVGGIPYFLPTGVVELSIESVKDAQARHKEFSLSVGSKLVPDPKKGYLLASPDHWYASKTHEVKLKDGMLSSISTEDENKIGEMITSLLSATANIYTFGATGGIQQSAADPDEEPTREEIAEALSMITPGKQSFAFSQESARRPSLWREQVACFLLRPRRSPMPLAPPRWRHPSLPPRQSPMPRPRLRRNRVSVASLPGC